MMNFEKYALQTLVFLLLILFVFSSYGSVIRSDRWSSDWEVLPEVDMHRRTPIAEKERLPQIGRLRPRKIDVKHIAIDLRFDWKKRQAYGTTTITLAPLQPTDNITLDAAYFTINSITISSGTSLKFEYAGGDKNDNLTINLGRVYASGENLVLKIEYRTNWANLLDPNSMAGGGNAGKGLRFSAPTSNDPIKPKEIWSMGDPESNRYWFPGYDSPDDFRTTEFTATVDKNLTVISNGILVNTKDNADGTRTFRYKMNTPYANHLTSFVVGEFVNVKKNYDGIELNNFGYPHEKDWVDASTERLPDMVKFFSEKTGVKYPYPSYSQVFVQDIGGFSGNNTVSTITENMVDDYVTHADYFYLWDLTEAEALAQQWFGNHLTARDWNHVWLNKSFARYFTLLYDEYKNGRENFLLWPFISDQGTYLSDWNSGIRRPIVTQNYDDVAAFTGDNYSTFRGALVLHMLRKQLGEEKWWKAIRLYVKSHGGKTVTTEDFRNAVEQASGVSMGWFFDQWIYKMGHPLFEVTKNYDSMKKRLTLYIKQTQKIDPKNKYPQAEFFKGKIDIEIDGRIEQIWLDAKAEDFFTVILPNAPKYVNFNFESTWICELKFERPLDELLYLIQNSKDALGRSSAMIEVVNFAKSDKASTEDKAKVRKALEAVISSNVYWRLRNSAVTQLQNLLAPDQFDDDAIATLIATIKRERSWSRAGAIRVLGTTKNPKFDDLYISYLNDPSERVIFNAAVALGTCKSPKAFDALAKLVNKPSMKSQSLLSALAGLRALGDPRGADIALKALSDLKLPRWRLPTAPLGWDYRPIAISTIVSLGKGKEAFPLIFERFKRSMAENDIEGIFNNAFLISILAEPRGQEVFEMLRAKYKDDANAMMAVNQYEIQFKSALVTP